MAELDLEIRAACEGGDYHRAATLAIQAYGPELMGFLVVVMRETPAAGDVFSDLCVRLWKSLPTFRWECSVRTWIYVLARRLCHAHRRAHAESRDRRVPLSEVPELDALIVRMRTTTLAKLDRSGTTRAERLRAKLAPDEQMLLTLRLDRELDWRAIARVLTDLEEVDEAALTREAAGLRKRFERIKEKLKRFAATES
ncbi:MAG: sigma-70 family RNA polymerase sigma factor [Kofleriaceae bacterium]